MDHGENFDKNETNRKTLLFLFSKLKLNLYQLQKGLEYHVALKELVQLAMCSQHNFQCYRGLGEFNE